MADMTMEEAIGTATPETQTGIYDNSYEGIAKKEQVRESVEKTDFFSSETAQSFGTRFGETNFINEAWDKLDIWVTGGYGKEDGIYMGQHDDDKTNAILKANNLPADDFLELRGARNPKEEGAILDFLIKRKENNEFAQNHMSDGMAMAAGVTGALLDIDTLLISPIAGILGKGKKISDIAKITFAAETAGVPLKAMMRDDYDVIRDGVLDVTVGVIADTALARMFGSRARNDLMRQNDLAVMEKQAIADFDLGNKSYWKEQELSALEKEQTEIAKDAQEQLRQANRTRLEEITVAKKQREEEAIRLEEEQVAKAQDIKGRTAEQRETELADIAERQRKLAKDDADAEIERKTLEEQQITIAQEAKGKLRERIEAETQRIEDEKKALLEERARIEQEQTARGQEASAELKAANAKRLEEIEAETKRLEDEQAKLDIEQTDEAQSAATALRDKNRKRLDELREEKRLREEESARIEAEQTARAQERKVAEQETRDKSNALLKAEEEVKKLKDKELEARAKERKKAEVEGRANSDALVKAEAEVKRLKDAEIEARARKTADTAAQKKARANKLVKAEAKAKKLKDKEIEGRVKKTADEAKAKKVRANKLVKAEDKAKKAKEDLNDAKLKERNLEKKQLLERRAAQQDEALKVIQKNLEPEVEKLRKELTEIALRQTDEERFQSVRHLKAAIKSLEENFPDLAGDIRKAFDDIDVKNQDFKTKMSLGKRLGIVGMGGAVIATGANASEFGGGDDSLGLAAIVALGVASIFLGSKIFKVIHNEEVLQTVLKVGETLKNITKMAEYSTSPSGSKMVNYISGLHNQANTRFNSTYQEIIGYGDAKAKVIADKLLFNPIDGKIGSADVEKMQMLHGEQAKVGYIMKATYREWLKEQGIGKMTSWSQAEKLRVEFNRGISDVMEGKPSTSAAMQTAADEMQAIFKKALDYADEVGVLGANAIVRSDNYLPRLWRFEPIHEMVTGLDHAGEIAFTKELARIIKSPNSMDEAQRLMGWFKNAKNFEGGQADEILERLDQFFKSGFDEQKAKEALQSTGDRSSRLKNRLTIDLMDMIDMKLDVNGKELTVGINTMVERDITKIADSYLNNMYGSIALAQRNYPSVAILREEIAQLSGKPREALDATLSLILGTPLKVNNQWVHDWVTTLKNLTFVIALPLVLFSMIPEALKTVANAGFAMTFRHLGGAIKTMNKDTELFRTLTELSGLATHRIRDKLDVKGLDNSELGEVGAVAWHSKASTDLAHNAAKMFGLVGGSDILQKITLLKSNTELGLWAKGMDNGLPQGRLGSYGMDDEARAMFKDDFTFNAEGQLTGVNSDGWSYAKRAKYNDIVFRMNQEITPEVVLGTIGRWTKDNEIGRLFSFLLSYPLNLYANQAVKDAHFMDRRTLSNTVFTFAGTYMGLMAKYELDGREYTHEQLVQYSLMNLPSLGVVSALRSILDPAAVHQAAGFKDEVDTLVGGAVASATGTDGKSF